MEDLDAKLAKLEINKKPIFTPLIAPGSTYYADGSIIPEGKVASLANTFQQSSNIYITKNSIPNSILKQNSSNGMGPKKVAPIVPPKPQKQLKSPEVPQSMLVQQACEPLYSKRLENTNERKHHHNQSDVLVSTNSSILNRNQPAYGNKSNFSSKINKISLDNPAILEQQLEALAHHKMQMEKKGLLQNNDEQLRSCNKKDNKGQNLNTIYTNVCTLPQANLLVNINSESDKKSIITYSNIAQYDNQAFANNARDTARVGSGIYRNLQLENEQDFSPPPTNVINGSTSHKITKHLDNPVDDDIPSPPSPVSSSYSELRRATDVFSKIPTPLDSQKPPSNVYSARLDAEAHTTNLYYPRFAESPNAGRLGPSNGQQNYTNITFNNEYSSYNENASLQSISQGSSDYYGYDSYSQGSSTYESIYEPINPSRQLTAQSNYFFYMQSMNDSHTAESSNHGSSGSISSLSAIQIAQNTQEHLDAASCQRNNIIQKHHNHKEKEVGSLTDFLVQSMDSSIDPDSYGICAKCNERVVGENSGCTAMDQVYHISCFTCSQCQINLQGKPFYSLEGNPYCEYDYLQTLEKCSVCMKPILERILRATGKPYHPQCFTCVVCGNSLDGIPFTVDATNQNYCIADFHKKFAPRCCVCKLPIMPEQGQEETVRVVALDRSFHFECYKCEDCGLLLSSEAEGRGCYPLDDHVLCKSCNAKQVQLLTNRMT